MKVSIDYLLSYSNYTYQITIDIIKCNTYFREKIACSVCNIQAEMLSSMENVENELANKNGKCISFRIFCHYALQFNLFIATQITLFLFLGSSARCILCMHCEGIYCNLCLKDHAKVNSK